MNKKKLLLLILFLSVCIIRAQEHNTGIFQIKRIGFMYSNAKQNNLIMNDKDYSYQTKTFKIQTFHDLGRWKNIDLELIVQPQIHSIQHQLINEQFVLPSEENYLEKRIEFTTPKNMHLYAIEFGVALKKKLLKKVDILATIGLGIATITKRTERLAKGFTFIENGALGISFQTSNTTFLYLGSSIGHISNLNFKSPNSGYNVLGYEIGFSYQLQ